MGVGGSAYLAVCPGVDGDTIPAPQDGMRTRKAGCFERGTASAEGANRRAELGRDLGGAEEAGSRSGGGRGLCVTAQHGLPEPLGSSLTPGKRTFRKRNAAGARQRASHLPGRTLCVRKPR